MALNGDIESIGSLDPFDSQPGPSMAGRAPTSALPFSHSHTAALPVTQTGDHYTDTLPDPGSSNFTSALFTALAQAPALRGWIPDPNLFSALLLALIARQGGLLVDAPKGSVRDAADEVVTVLECIFGLSALAVRCETSTKPKDLVRMLVTEQSGPAHARFASQAHGRARSGTAASARSRRSTLGGGARDAGSPAARRREASDGRGQRRNTGDELRLCAGGSARARGLSDGIRPPGALAAARLSESPERLDRRAQSSGAAARGRGRDGDGEAGPVSSGRSQSRSHGGLLDGAAAGRKGRARAPADHSDSDVDTDDDDGDVGMGREPDGEVDEDATPVRDTRRHPLWDDLGGRLRRHVDTSDTAQSVPSPRIARNVSRLVQSQPAQQLFPPSRDPTLPAASPSRDPFAHLRETSRLADESDDRAAPGTPRELGGPRAIVITGLERAPMTVAMQLLEVLQRGSAEHGGVRRTLDKVFLVWVRREGKDAPEESPFWLVDLFAASTGMASFQPPPDLDPGAVIPENYIADLHHLLAFTHVHPPLEIHMTNLISALMLHPSLRSSLTATSAAAFGALVRAHRLLQGGFALPADWRARVRAWLGNNDTGGGSGGMPPGRAGSTSRPLGSGVFARQMSMGVGAGAAMGERPSVSSPGGRAGGATGRQQSLGARQSFGAGRQMSMGLGSAMNRLALGGSGGPGSNGYAWARRAGEEPDMSRLRARGGTGERDGHGGNERGSADAASDSTGASGSGQGETKAATRRNGDDWYATPRNVGAVWSTAVRHRVSWRERGEESLYILIGSARERAIEEVNEAAAGRKRPDRSREIDEALEDILVTV